MSTERSVSSMLAFVGVVSFILAIVFLVRWGRRWAFQHLDGISVKADSDFLGGMLCAAVCMLCLICSVL